MNIRTLLKYLIGNRQAILNVASDRSALKVGFLFVLAAGFAREYDAKDLLHQPWWLLVPLAASITLSFVLFCLLRVVMSLGKGGPAFWRTYPRFLGLFWMTAPLALLYAVPYERLLSPEAATGAKLWTLAIVSGWRVLLMIRVTSVICGTRWTVFPVMFLADAAAIIALAVAPLPVINIMGGIRHTESERLILGTALWLGFFAVTSALVWFLGMFWLVDKRPLTWELPEARAGRSRSLLIAGVACLVVWAPILPFTQPQQQLAHRAESLLRQGSIAEAVKLLSANREWDLPPHWEPPPRVGYGESHPDVSEVIRQCDALGAAPWVRRIYIEKAPWEAASHPAPADARPVSSPR